MRHGDAPVAEFDSERMLSELGKRQCLLVAGYIEASKVGAVLSSDYQRAIDSAHLATDGLQALNFFETEKLRPMAETQLAFTQILQYLDSLNDDASLLVVCHMPIISALAGLAVYGNTQAHTSFPCASLMHLRADFSGLACFDIVDHIFPTL